LSDASRKNVVTVRIAGDEYAIRSDASPEYTEECAAYVDRTVTEIIGHGALIEGHKAVILTALSLTDQLFQARAEIDSIRREIARLAARLSSDIEAALTPDA
jgi:cell division protein ZapA (FtsZ GTPase activity inhibitor)